MNRTRTLKLPETECKLGNRKLATTQKLLNVVKNIEKSAIYFFVTNESLKWNVWALWEILSS